MNILQLQVQHQYQFSISTVYLEPRQRTDSIRHGLTVILPINLARKFRSCTVHINSQLSICYSIINIQFFRNYTVGMELKNGYVREFETEITALKLGTTHYSICVSGKIKYVSLCVPKSLNNNNNKLKFRNTTIKISLYSAVFNLIIPETFMIKIGLVTYT